MAGNSVTNEWCERLYESEAAKILLYGRALGLSHGESEDVLQETFTGLLTLASPPESPNCYAWRAFRNRALNYKRSLWRRLTREVESMRWFEKPTGETGLEKAAMDSLAKLPAEQREVIVLKIWSEMTFEQIATLLEISPNTVAGRYRYGLQKLRIALNRSNYERLELPGNSVENMEPAATFA